MKDTLYGQFARVGKAVASPRRIELLELLGQGEARVEALAELAAMGVTNTSAHLQVLRQARLVETRRVGTQVFYRLADDTVARFVGALRDLAQTRLVEVEQVVRDYFTTQDDLEPVSTAELAARIRDGDVVVLDVRPAGEFAAGHIDGARSIPLEVLAGRLDELPDGVEVVAYCRGPYCVLAPAALELLHRKGFRARRLAQGFPEWRLAGLPVAMGRG